MTVQRPLGAWRGVRFIEGEWHLRCDDCGRDRQTTAYWPLTLDFWNPAWGMTRCRACWHRRHVVRTRRWRMRNPEWHTADNAGAIRRRSHRKLAAMSDLRRLVA